MGRDGRAASVVTTNTTGTTSNTTAVQVALRIRPLTQKDRTQPRFANVNDDDCLKVMGNTVRVVPHNKLFTFDHVFGPNTQQHEIFSTLGENLVHKFVEGYNVTVLAYGQTSSGKTFTMGTAQHNGRFDEAEEGIVPRAMALLFEALQHQAYERPASFLPPPTTAPTSLQRPASPTSSVSSSATSLSKGSRLRPRSRLSHVPTPTPTPSRSSRLNNPASSSASNFKYTVKVSFVEIYNEELNDLLNDAPPAERPPVTIREDTKGHIYWTGVKEVSVSNADDVLFYLEQGTRSRATGATDMNEKSSRSHAIFSVTLQQEKSSLVRSESPSPLNMKRSSGRHDDGECVITTSKFHFVDLAGSERLKRTAAEGDRRKEGININAGLHALGNVISALGDLSKRGTHVPYRDSKLTRLLQDSLGGNATTLMIACASPVEFNLSETLNTLQYANRARNIKNRSEKNQVEEWMTTDNLELLRALIGKLKNEVNYLKSPSSNKGAMSSSATIDGFDDDDDDHDEMDFEHQDTDQVLQEHRLIIADLQHQIEELDGEASVTRERNKMVEVELQRLRKLEQLRNKKEQENLDFEHLVEPVIEEYEKSIAKLESELSVSRAALTHSNIGLDDLQTKYDDLQRVLDHQQEAMSDLQLRFTKVAEREQSNDTYIEELESKLEQSAHDSMRDQDTLNELRNRVAKWKENEDNNEHYIQDLEKRLAASEENHIRLSAALEVLELKCVEQDNVIVDLKQQVKKASENGLSQQQSILTELDNLNEKYTDLEKERDQWKNQAQQHQESNQALLHQSANDMNHKAALISAPLDEDRDYRRGSNDKSHSQKTNRRSLADEKETSASFSALAAKEAMMRADEQASRVRVLEMQLEKLGNEHKHTIKELDSVLQRYHEALEQVDHLEHNSVMATHQPSATSTLTDASQSSSLSSSSFSGRYPTGIATPTTAEGGSLDDTHPATSSMGCLLDQEMGRAQDQEHRDTIDRLELEIKTLETKVDEQKRELQSIRQAKEEQQAAYEADIVQLKSTIQRLETDGDDAKQLVRTLTQAAEDHDDFVERTVLQLDEATESNAALMKQYTTTQTALKTLQQKHRSVIEDRNELTQRLERLTLENDNTLEDHRTHEGMDTLKQTIQLRDQQVQQLETALAETQDQLKRLQASAVENKQGDVVQSNLNTREQSFTDMTAAMEKQRLEAAQQMESARLAHLAEIEHRQQDALDKDNQHQADLAHLDQTHQTTLEQEKAKLKDLENVWLERQAEWTRRLDDYAKAIVDKDETHQTTLEQEKAKLQDLENVWQERQVEWTRRMEQHEKAMADKEAAHQDLVKQNQTLADKESAEALEQHELAWADRQKEWDGRIKQLEQELLENDDRHQATLKEISQAHNDMMDKNKTEALNELESVWLERQAEWTRQIEQHEKAMADKEAAHQDQLEHLQALVGKESAEALQQQESLWLDRQKEWDGRIRQMEQELLENDDRHQVTLKEISQAHTDMMDKNKTEALKELESVWLERQAEWAARIQALEQEGLDTDQRHQDTIKEISQAHTDLFEKEKAQAHQIESSWLERQAEWTKRIERLEAEAADKDKAHKEAIEDHVARMEKNKAEGLGNLDSVWLEKQAKWDQERQRLEQDVLALDLRHQSTVKELSQTHMDLLAKEKSDSLKQLEALWKDRQLKWDEKIQGLESVKTELTDRVTSLETDLDATKKDLRETQTKLQEAEEDLAEFEELLQAADTNLETMTTRAEEAENTIKYLETVLDDAVKENEGLNEKLKGMEPRPIDHDYQALVKKNEEAHDRVKQLEETLNSYSGQEETVKGIKPNHVEMDRHSASSPDTKLNDDLLEMETLYHQSEKQHEITMQKLNDALSKVSLYESQLSSSQDTYNNALADHQARLDDMEKRYQQMEAAKNQLEAYQQQLTSDHDSTHQQHLKAQALKTEEIAALEKRYADAGSQHNERLEELERQHVATLEQLTTLQQSHSDALSELASLRSKETNGVASTHESEFKKLAEENQEYAELTSTLEQELNRMTLDMDKLVIEVGENEVTLQDQAMQIQRLEAENQSADEWKKHVAKTHQDQVRALEEQNQQLESNWDQDKQQMVKLTKQVKILEEKLELVLQEKKKFLCF